MHVYTIFKYTYMLLEPKCHFLFVLPLAVMKHLCPPLSHLINEDTRASPLRMCNLPHCPLTRAAAEIDQYGYRKTNTLRPAWSLSVGGAHSLIPKCLGADSGRP